MTDKPFLPEWVTRKILDHPKCDLCGDPVLTEGRTRHVICELIAKEKSK